MKQRQNKSVYEPFLSKLLSVTSRKGMKFKHEKNKLASFFNWSNSNLLWLIITTIVVLMITFWSVHVTSFGFVPNNLETIAVIFVAYHETSCIGAVETALLNAKYPNRVSFFVVNAGSAKSKQSISCLNGYNDFQSGRGSEIIAKNIDLISETFSESYGINAAKSELINKEIIAKNKKFDYVMELHAHSLFNNNWDIETISEWKLVNNQHSILTTYPSRTSEISSRQFDHHKGSTMNIICAAKFKATKNGWKVTYENPWEIKPPTKDGNGNFVPVEIPFWSSFFSFGPFDYILNVKYDPNLKVITENDGVEFLYSLRLRTSGYKMYAPVKDLVFHNYEAHKFETQYRVKRDKKQLKSDQVRMNSLLLQNSSFVMNNDEFGFGHKMSLKKCLEIVSVDLQKYHSDNLCDKIKHKKWRS